ncbi:hypothetical protein PR202_ga24587 [Eleusine coracana subsp. coracana]|uniref:Secreted protein n=1 Tax=Eleusine coracana subsp. coracana TaxID=191504 RepID=A0AAV5D9W2_ELECO|nr:hypothetical protein PR202_ga24587 [Eleusine coracana subsp. coracana]
MIQNLKQKKICGICSLCCALWLYRNHVVFNKSSIPSYLQVIFRVTHWLRLQALLLMEKKHPLLKTVCRLIETVAMQIFIASQIE